MPRQKVNKGRLAGWFGEPDLILQVTLCSIFLTTINKFLNIKFINNYHNIGIFYQNLELTQVFSSFS